ncbi:MAG: hypothetical protein ACKO0M_11835 [Cyanobium sp.]
MVSEQVQLELVANGFGERLPFQVIGPVSEAAFLEELIEEEFGSLTINPRQLFGFLNQDKWIQKFFEKPKLIDGSIDGSSAPVSTGFSGEALGNKLVKAGILDPEELEQLLEDYRPFSASQRFGEFLRLNLQVSPKILDLLLNPASFNEQGLNEKRLGERLLEMELITQEQLDQALAEQSRSKRRIGEILAELGHISPTMARFFSMVKLNEKGQLDYSAD